jgi:4-hydroxy-2-oxoheptanedioate aldolase
MSSTSSSRFSLARRLRLGETVFSAWCGLPAPLVAENVARAGFSAAVIDQQHGLWDTATTLQAIAGIHQAGSAPIVRVPLNDFAGAARVLDFGAEGVIAPMINSSQDARAFVLASKYPPLGERSVGAHRAAALAGFPDQRPYLKEANDTTLTMAMIETRAAMANLDAIAGTPGIDMLFVGPSDLSMALSDGKTLDAHSDEVEAALEKILAACKKAGKIPGLYCIDAERAASMAKRGFKFLTVGSDLAFLRAGAVEQLKVLNTR